MTTVGLVSALPAETRCLIGTAATAGTVVNNGRTLVAVSGTGAQRARQAAELLLGRGASALISWGTAGALAPDLRSGSLLLPQTVLIGQAQSFSTAAAWRNRLARHLRPGLHAHTGAILHTGRIVDAPSDKARLHASTQALAVDMESAAIAQCAVTAGVPFLVIRAIVDEQAMVVPHCAVAATDEDGRTHLSRLLAGLVRKPSAVLPLARLGGAFRAALATLATVAELAGPDFRFAA